MKHIDLFSGIGGFALAAKWAGIETITFCEKNKFCREVLAKHWPHVPILNDIKDINVLEHCDIMTAGFPCQPFSLAGKKKGKDDERYLWPELIRVIRLSKPTWFIGENVSGIIPCLDTILEDLEGEGYVWRAFLIPASAAGAPHKRERLWIVAHSNSSRCNSRGHTGKERYLQSNWQRHIEAIQSEWTQFKPESWETFKTQVWLEQNRSKISRVDDGLPDRLDRNKSLGNAVIPQIPYVFMSMIKMIESQ